jgi:hypothetical protein
MLAALPVLKAPPSGEDPKDWQEYQETGTKPSRAYQVDVALDKVFFSRVKQ